MRHRKTSTARTICAALLLITAQACGPDATSQDNNATSPGEGMMADMTAASEDMSPGVDMTDAPDMQEPEPDMTAPVDMEDASDMTPDMQEDMPPDMAPPGPMPVATFTFPMTNALAEQETLTIFGATELDGAEITEVRVGGEPATSDDGFQTWQIEVTLDDGVNTFTLEWVDAEGNTHTPPEDNGPLEITRRPRVLDFYSELSLDAPDTRGLYFSNASDAMALMEYDFTTHATRVASDDAVVVDDVDFALNGGTIVSDRSGGDNQAYILDNYQANYRILRVDLDTGIKSIVTDRTISCCRGIQQMTAPFLDKMRNRIVVVSGGKELLAVDLSTGRREQISGNMRGQGPTMNGYAVSAVAYDRAGSKFYLAGTQGVMQIDEVTGDRVIVASSTVGTGPAFGQVRGIVFHPESGDLFVHNRNERALMRIDVATGDRVAVLAFGDQDPGHNRLEYDEATQTIWFHDVNAKRILTYDIVAEVASVVVGNQFPLPMTPSTSVAVPTINAAVLDQQRGKIITTAWDLSFTEFDLGSGLFSPLDATLPQPSMIEREYYLTSRELALEQESMRLWVPVTWNVEADEDDFYYSDLLLLDYANRSSELLYYSANPDAPAPQAEVVDVAIDDAHDAVYSVDEDGGIYKLDVATGMGSLLSGQPATDVDPEWLHSPRQMIWDEVNNRLFVLDLGAGGRLVAVDAASGMRDVVHASASMNGRVAASSASWATARSIALDPAGSVIWVYARGEGSENKLFTFDLITEEWKEAPATSTMPRYDLVMDPLEQGGLLTASNRADFGGIGQVAPDGCCYVVFAR